MRRGRRRTIATRLLAWFLLMASLPLAAVLFLTTRNDAAKLRRDGFATVANLAFSGALWRVRRRTKSKARPALDTAAKITH